MVKIELEQCWMIFLLFNCHHPTLHDFFSNTMLHSPQFSAIILEHRKQFQDKKGYYSEPANLNFHGCPRLNRLQFFSPEALFCATWSFGRSASLTIVTCIKLLMSFSFPAEFPILLYTNQQQRKHTNQIRCVSAFQPQIYNLHAHD